MSNPEFLESRTLLVVSFAVTFDDPGGAQSAFYADLEQNTLAAGAELAQFLDGTASIEIVIGFSSSIPTANGGSETVVVFGADGPLTLVQSGTAAEVRTGTDPNGADPDLRITIGIDYLTDELYLDPTPFDGTDPIPSDKSDAFSTLLHEIVHAFGFIGYGDNVDGSLPDAFATLFDSQVTFVADNFYFNGPRAVALYGGPVPLTYGNHFHVANTAPRPGSELLTDLMNGVTGYRGVRDVISALDLAILADTSLPLLADAAPNSPPDIAAATFDLADGSPTGAVVGMVVATDIDVTQTRTFAIVAGNPTGTFSIDAASGSITVADGSLLDINVQATYVLTVEVTDSGSPALSDSAEITISLFERTIPRVATSDGATTLTKGSTAVIDPSITLESESDFTDPAGSKLKVAITTGSTSKDRLTILDKGVKSTRLKLTRGSLKKGKTVIATTTGGTGDSPLAITFLPTATVDDIELVLKKTALKTSRKNSGSRTIEFQFFLEDGSTGEPDTKEVIVP